MISLIGSYKVDDGVKLTFLSGISLSGISVHLCIMPSNLLLMPPVNFRSEKEFPGENLMIWPRALILTDLESLRNSEEEDGNIGIFKTALGMRYSNSM